LACDGNTWLPKGCSVGTRITIKPRAIDWWQALHPSVNSPTALTTFKATPRLDAAYRDIFAHCYPFSPRALYYAKQGNFVDVLCSNNVDRLAETIFTALLWLAAIVIVAEWPAR
jgi:hypothetical protein